MFLQSLRVANRHRFHISRGFATPPPAGEEGAIHRAEGGDPLEGRLDEDAVRAEDQCRIRAVDFLSTAARAAEQRPLQGLLGPGVGLSGQGHAHHSFLGREGSGFLGRPDTRGVAAALVQRDPWVRDADVAPVFLRGGHGALGLEGQGGVRGPQHGRPRRECLRPPVGGG